MWTLFLCTGDNRSGGVIYSLATHFSLKSNHLHQRGGGERSEQALVHPRCFMFQKEKKIFEFYDWIITASHHFICFTMFMISTSKNVLMYLKVFRPFNKNAIVCRSYECVSPLIRRFWGFSWCRVRLAYKDTDFSVPEDMFPGQCVCHIK